MKKLILANTILAPLLLASHILISSLQTPDQATPPPSTTRQPVHPQNQPRRTNSWFTSAYDFPSEVVFALPGSYKVTTQGIELGAPQPTAEPKGVFASHIALCTLTTPDLNLTSSKINYYGEWDFNLTASSQNHSLTMHLAQGMPVGQFSSDSAVMVNCTQPPDLSDGQIHLTNGNSQLIIQAQAGECIQSMQNQYRCQSSTGEYRSIILPTDSQITAQDLDWFKLNLTSSSFQHQNNQTITSLNFHTQDSQEVLTTLWPHHQKITNPGQTKLGTYQTSRGPMHLTQAYQLNLTQTSAALPDTFTAITDTTARQSLVRNLNADIAQYLNESAPSGVYFKGTWLGALTTLTQLNQLYGNQSDTDKLLDKLTQELDLGLTTLYYDPQDTMIKARNDEFGNSKGNDHHFHYSYYIRAATVLIENRPALITKYQTQISPLIADIATTSYSTKFPHYRAFNIYEGHSYADGQAKFADGNNQESTSESLNAWYAIQQWGRVTQNPELQDLGLWLFTQELNSVSHYWFFPPELKPQGFDHQMFSIVWLGKRDFATWFSAHPLHIYGIQWLPITPASGYFSTLPNREAHIQDLANLLGEQRYAHEWSDLYLIYLSTVDPQLAKHKLPQLQTSAGAKLRALPWQYIYSQ